MIFPKPEVTMPIVMTARFEVMQDKLEICERVIREFVDYVHANEPDTLLYTSVQETDKPTGFLHYFMFRDEQAREIHSSSAAVDKFTAALYPNLIEPVKFTEYTVLATTTKSRRGNDL